MKKKFLALVMTLSMVLSLVPMTALATGDGQKQETPVATEGQPAGAGANEGKQESGSNTGANNASGGDSTGTSDTNTNNGSNENAGGTESGDSSTSGTGSTEGGDTGTGGGTESGGTTTPPESSNKVAKIGNNKYETLDEAIEAAKENDVIELLKDCELTVGTINKTITINGNGKKLTVPKQKKIESGALAINAHATFNNTQLSFANESDWSVTMSGDGVFTLDQHSICTFETHGLYADNNATINVTGGSELKLQDTKYTAMMADRGYAYLNITQGSSILVDHAYVGDEKPNGINNFKIKVENSNITVTNCENQGLVRCQLTLDNSKAEISGNDTGITGFTETDVLTMKNSSTLTMENNKNAGIFIWGGKVDIQNGNTLTITGTGSANTGAVTPDYYNGAVAVCAKTGNANVSFADGATVILKNNGLSAINNLSTTSSSFYVGSGTEITCNGDKTNYGGGIYNFGSITIADGAKVYNNHAAIAGDDIYSSSINKIINKKEITYTGNISFCKTGEDWKLDDCTPEHPILGWYKDGMESNEDKSLKRWNGHGDGETYYAVEYTAPATEVTEALALKAAHPKMYSVTYSVSGEIPAGYKTPAQKYYKDPFEYTVENVPSSIPGTKDGVNGTYSFTGWQTKNGDFVTGPQPLKEDTTLYGKWTFTKKSSGHRPSNPPVTIPDDVPTGLDLKNHYGYIIGYPVDYYTGKPTTDQTKKPVRPEGKITRAEVATIYFRMLTDENRAANWNQVSGFSDVKSSAWYNNAISTLTKAGILKGYEDGTFQPNGYITRAEFATIAIRFFSGVYEGEDLFPDIKGHWAEDYINNAANKGLVKGYEDGTFGPDRYITRAEAVTLVNRTLNRHPHNDGLHQDMLRWPDNMDTSKWYYADMQEATNSHEPDKDKTTADKEYWGKMLPIRDWEALEKEWSNANSAPGEGEVV